MNKLDKAASIIGWIQIFASPFLAGVIIAFLAWLSLRNTTGIIIASMVVLIEIIAGILLAEKARKSKGTVKLISRLDSAPELDEKNREV